AAGHFKTLEADQRRLAKENMTLADDRESARRLAEQKRDQAQRNAYLADMRVAQKDLEAGSIHRLYQHLVKYVPDDGLPDLRNWEWYYLLSRTRQDLTTLREHTNGVWQVAWSSDGTLLASRDSDRGILIRDTDTWKVVGEIGGKNHGFMAWSQDGRRLAIADAEGRVAIRDASTRALLQSLGPFERRVTSIRWSPDDTRLAVRAYPHTHIVRLKDGATMQSWRPAQRLTSDAAVWSPKGDLVADGSELRDPESGRVRAKLDLMAQVTGLEFHPSRPWVATGHYRGDLVIIDYEKNERIAHRNLQTSVEDLAWSPDGRYIVAGTRGHRAVVLESDAFKEVEVYQGHLHWLTSVSWSPDGRRIATAAEDGLVKIWAAPDFESETVTSNDLEVVVGFTGQARQYGINHIGNQMLSPDGKYIAGVVKGARKYSGAVSIWNLEQRSLVHMMTGHTPNRYLMPPKWSPDGELIATGGWDHYLLLWDAATGEIRHRLAGHTAWVHGFNFSPDGTRLASRSGDRTIKLWDVDSGAEILTIEC
ncbi:MAG: WD40 repeat domain-containing protein, partial [Verrucomicrobiota bacterium]